MKKVDKLDLKILQIISVDARVPFKDVAEVCGVSRAAIQYGIFGHYLVGLCTEQYAYCCIVRIVFYKVVVHPYIHVQLPHVCMCQRVGLQFKQDISFKFDVIEHQVDIEI